MRASLVFLCATLTMAACYRPSIDNGAFKCGADAGLCPDGYTCDPDLNLCTNGPLDLSVAQVDTFSAALGDFTPVALPGGSTLVFFVGDDTKDGKVAGTITLDGQVVVSPATPGFSMGFNRLTQPDGTPVAVWSFGKVNIPANMAVSIDGHLADSVLVVTAKTDLEMDGSINASKFGGFGGGVGKAGSRRPTSLGLGGSPAVGPHGGGGGGGYTDDGDPGMGNENDIGDGGPQFSANGLAPILFGSGGGGSLAAVGGNGGGAVALLALGNLIVGGKIDASGAGGGVPMIPDAGTSGAGGGGGSGGSVLLSGGTSVMLNNSFQLLVTGGRGGVGDDGKGGDGSIGAIQIDGTLSSSSMPAPSGAGTGDAVTMFPQLMSN